MLKRAWKNVTTAGWLLTATMATVIAAVGIGIAFALMSLVGVEPGQAAAGMSQLTHKLEAK